MPKLVLNKEVQILFSIISAVFLHGIMESVNENLAPVFKLLNKSTESSFFETFCFAAVDCLP